jgi:RNA polymerase sigma factor (sigma-70 family)
MGPNSDEELIAGIQANDDNAILRFVETYQDRVYHQALGMLGNTQDAEEASQDVFIKALKNMKLFEGRSKLSTWLYQIAYTTCLDVLKKRKRQPRETEIEDDSTSTWDSMNDGLKSLEQEDQRGIIDSALQRLDPKDSALVNLYHLQELSIKEVSEITNINPGAIKVRLLRARKKLAAYLERDLHQALAT